MSRKRQERKKQHETSGNAHSKREKELSDKPEHIHIDGGRIETDFSPNLVEEYRTGQKQQRTRESKQYIVSVFTLIGVAIYTSLTFWQGCTLRKQLEVSRDTLNAVNRPYVGTVVHLSRDTKANILTLNFSLKNFGSIPADNFIADWNPTIDGKRQPGEREVQQGPSVLFPSDSFTFVGTFVGSDLDQIMNHTKILEVEVVANYTGPGGKQYQHCSKHRFWPNTM